MHLRLQPARLMELLPGTSAQNGVCSGARVWGGVVHAALHACENQSMVRMAENFSLRPERDRPERKVPAIPKRGSSLAQLGSPPVG